MAVWAEDRNLDADSLKMEFKAMHVCVCVCGRHPMASVDRQEDQNLRHGCPGLRDRETALMQHGCVGQEELGETGVFCFVFVFLF